MLFLSVDTIAKFLQTTGLRSFFPRVIEKLRRDFLRWEEFQKSARHATHYPEGVIELMPCADQQYYAFKYVNGHPGNPQTGKLSVFAFGVLTDARTGYPLLFSEMTLLTALRTAATAALAASHLARPESAKLALIGTGAQAEFVTWALQSVLPITHVYYFDTDHHAMSKYERNIAAGGLQLFRADSVAKAVAQADIIVTATAAKQKAGLIKPAMLAPGQCFLGLGGDCPGKTEFDPAALAQCKIVVEYLPQSLVEGEIQDYTAGKVHAELWELVSGKKPGRLSDQEITLFDSVGFALEDYSILKLFYQMANAGEINASAVLDIVPQLSDPKNLYGLIRS